MGHEASRHLLTDDPGQRDPWQLDGAVLPEHPRLDGGSHGHICNREGLKSFLISVSASVDIFTFHSVLRSDRHSKDFYFLSVQSRYSARSCPLQRCSLRRECSGSRRRQRPRSGRTEPAAHRSLLPVESGGTIWRCHSLQPPLCTFCRLQGHGSLTGWLPCGTVRPGGHRPAGRDWRDPGRLGHARPLPQAAAGVSWRAPLQLTARTLGGHLEHLGKPTNRHMEDLRDFSQQRDLPDCEHFR